MESRSEYKKVIDAVYLLRVSEDGKSLKRISQLLKEILSTWLSNGSHLRVDQWLSYVDQGVNFHVLKHGGLSKLINQSVV